LPLSWGYKGVMALRNTAYNKGWFPTSHFDLPLVGVGNLSMGGTGKSPMTEYIVRLVQEHYLPATLSRGYGRSTSGFIEVQPSSTAKEVGDEPLQFKRKFPKISVVVDENRVHAIKKMLKQKMPIEVLVLDDIFQHRKVKTGFLILLTSYDALFYEDHVVPAGNLRESRKGANRADVVVVTKCPSTLTRAARKKITEKIQKYTRAPVFFSRITYDTRVSGTESIPLSQLQNTELTVVTGIANPKPFVDFLKANNLDFKEKRFPDHHNFTEKEVAVLDRLPVILTTEKDYMRLKTQLTTAQLYYLPIQFSFLEDGNKFDEYLLGFIESSLANAN